MRLATRSPRILFCCLAFSSVAVATSASRAVTTVNGPPSFFIRDQDGQCLAGTTFKRCGIDTLWFVQGQAGSYQLHRRLVDEIDLEECLGKTHCHLDESSVRLSNCNHCGAQKWNILGDENEGYYITQDRERYCLRRDGSGAYVSNCDNNPVRYNIKFATKRDITSMSSDGARFVLAAADGDLNGVKDLLLRKISPNVRDWEQRTPLLAAVANGNIDIVRYLISKKADILLSDRDDVTVLVEAVISGHIEMLKYLVTLPNVDSIINSPAASGATPLWFAAAEGKDSMVQLLLSIGADANMERLDGISPVIAAAAGGHESSVIILLKAGADILHRTSAEGLTALLAACENGSLPLVEVIVEAGANINTLSTAGFSPLIVGAANGFDNIVEYLLANGAEPDLPHPENITALMYAAAGGFLKTVQLLLSPLSNGRPGSDVNRRHKLGGSALMEAATKGSIDVYRLLINSGADSSVSDIDGVTILMTASSHGRIDLVRFLLSEGETKAEINKLSDSGGTALMYAAGGGHAEMCRILIFEGGADIDVRVKASPGYLARVKVHKQNDSSIDMMDSSDVSSMLEASEVEHSDGGTALTVAAEGGFLDVTKVLVEAGADIYAVADDNHTALTYSFVGGHTVIVEYLLDSGADPNDTYRDEKGMQHNLLYDCVLSSNVSVALKLIKNGAGVAHIDGDGIDLLMHSIILGHITLVDALLGKTGHKWMPLHNYLISASSVGNIEIVKMLVSYPDCDINGKDSDGSDALMAAAARGQKEIVEFLLLQSDISVNAQNIDGHSALMFANNGISQVLNVLSKLQGYLDGDDEEDEVISTAISEYQGIIDLLSSAGANPNLKDQDGHIAADFNILLTQQSSNFPKNKAKSPNPKYDPQETEISAV